MPDVEPSNFAPETESADHPVASTSAHARTRPLLEPIHAAMELDDTTVLWSGPLARLGGPAILMVAGIVAEPFIVLLRWLGLGTGYIVVLCILATVVLIYFAAKAMPHRPRSSVWAKNPDGLTSDPKVRLRVVGNGEENLALLNAIATDESFEPVIFRSWGAHQFLTEIASSPSPFRQRMGEPANRPIVSARSELNSRARMWVFGTAFVLSIGTAIAIKASGFRISAHLFPHYHELLGAAGLAYVIVGWLRPSYIRISPGRLDVLQWSFLGVGKPTCVRYDLRSAFVVVIPGSRTARIRIPPSPDGKPANLPMLTFRWISHEADQRDISATILRAARTRYPTPDLPEDAFVS